ncbi:MAG: UDP-glucose 4-epimerase GalE [Clostridiales bacterium]|nr:UDP-glucose 4-epimerase GalE [Clostridiales bacterium]
MKVLITGGAGYIGSHTAVELIAAGHDICVVDNYSNSSPAAIDRIRMLTDRPFNAYDCDVRDRERLMAVFAGEKPDAVIHFAGLKAVGESVQKPLEYYSNNLTSTTVLLDCMRENGCKIIVFSSSATVYGSENPVPFREDMPEGATSSPYGTTKKFIERILTDVAAADSSLSVSLLRYFNPVGAHPSGVLGENPNGIPNNLMPFIMKVAAGKIPELTVFGGDYPTPDGTCLRDYIHVVDLAKGHVKALDRAAGRTGTEIFNLGTGKPTSVLEIIRAFEKASGKPLNYKVGPRREGDIPMCYSDPSKAKRDLGWTADLTIDDMCRDSWNFISKNPNGYDS